MSYYPVFLDLAGRSCAVIGAGEVAERKIEGLLRAGARVTVIAATASAAIRALGEAGGLVHHARGYEEGDLQGFFLAVAATDGEEVNRRVTAEARRLGVLLNVVDAPELCDFIAPAVLERGELQIAVSTSGSAPALAGRLRDRIAEVVGPEYGPALRILRKVRERLRAEQCPAAERRLILERLAAADLPAKVREQDRAAIDRLLSDTVGAGTTLEALEVSLD